MQFRSAGEVGAGVRGRWGKGKYFFCRYYSGSVGMCSETGVGVNVVCVVIYVVCENMTSFMK